MKGKIIRDLLILVGIFGLIWLFFSLFSYPEDPVLLSVEKEQRLGESYLDLVWLNPMFGEFDNHYVDSTVDVIGERLAGGLEDSQYTYNFLVFESEMINAFTVPGGNILISTGLISFCDTPEELASVLAHEMGHVEKRHVITRLLKEMSIEIITSSDPFVMGEIAGQLTSTSFDRKQEEAADLFAAQLLEQASIEPRTLATFFRKLEEEKNHALMEHFEIISTHPNLRSRIRATLSYSPGDEFETEALGLDWEAVLNQLK